MKGADWTSERGIALSKKIYSTVSNFIGSLLSAIRKGRHKVPQRQKRGTRTLETLVFGADRNFEREQTSDARVGPVLRYDVSLPVLLLLCFFHAVVEALPPLTFLPPLIPLLLTFELCTERWET